METVGLSEARALLVGKDSPLSRPSRSGKAGHAVPDLDNIAQEPINDSDALMTVVPLVTAEAGLHSRILLLRLDGAVKGAVFHMAAEGTGEEGFTGKIFITDLEGDLLRAYRVADGRVVAELVKRNGRGKAPKDVTLGQLALAARANKEADSCPYSDPSWCRLDEVTV